MEKVTSLKPPRPSGTPPLKRRGIYPALTVLRSYGLMVFFLFLFAPTNTFAQTDFIYATDGKIENFKIRKDKVIIKCRPNTNLDAFIEQSFFTTAFHFRDNLVIADIDTLKTNLHSLQRAQNVADVTYALEYADGAIQMPTYNIVTKMKAGRSLEELYNRSGLAKHITNIKLADKYQEIYLVTLDLFLGDILQISRNLHETGWCEIAAPSFIVEMKLHGAPSREPNPDYPKQWGLKNSGQNPYSMVGVDINVEPAWSITKGMPNIKVALLDVGVQLNHEDLEDNLLPGYDATDGYHGGENGSYWGDNDHGTCCAGIIGAVDNDTGIIGVAPHCKIIPIRIGYEKEKKRGENPEWSLVTDDYWLADGINRAWDDFGADVLSCSWSVGYLIQTNAAIQNAIKYGRNNKGCVIVAASGYYDVTGGSHDVKWPAKLPTVLAVGAILDDGRRVSLTNSSWGSCFGGNSLNVIAPGAEIYTTTIDTLKNFSGTSAACPHVAGIAALILSVDSCLTEEQVRKIIVMSCKKVTPERWYDTKYLYTYSPVHKYGTWNVEMGHGLVDAYKAVMYAMNYDQIHFFDEPGVITDVSESADTLTIDTDAWSTINAGYGWISNPVIFGTYIVKRHEIRATVSYNPILSPAVQGISNGFSSETLLNDGNYFMELESISDTSATVKTYVYKVLQRLNGDPPPANGWIPVHPDSVRFHVIVMCDTTQYKLYLQNHIETETKAFNVITDIAAGNAVNPAEPAGDYIIQNGASVSLHAGETILLSDGFTANAGSYFHAYIEPFFNCTYIAKTPERDDYNEQVYVIKDYSVEKTDFQTLEATTSDGEFYLKIYPNPSTGNITVEYNLNRSAVVKITLHDNYGKPVYILKNRTPHDAGTYKISLTGVELPAGIYYCTLKTENIQKTEKLMIVR